MSLSIAAAAGPWTLFSANVNTLALGKRASDEECIKGITTVADQIQSCIPKAVTDAAIAGKTITDADLYTPAYAQCLCPTITTITTLFQDAQCRKLIQTANAQAGTPIGDAEMAANTKTLQAGVTACAAGRYDEVARLLQDNEQTLGGSKGGSPTATRPGTGGAPAATPSSTPSGTGNSNNAGNAAGTNKSGASTLSASTVVVAAAAAAGIVFFAV
ncbi:hypothetical protein DFS34DRAFT_89873 [Phlyctochytrium arcticum]|nr:hypothetical protein DFS34DRAFT_89873 [Phlyctochytrium arcticum]